MAFLFITVQIENNVLIMEQFYKITDFDLERFFSSTSEQFEYDNGNISVGDDISCRNLEDLKKKGGAVVCCVDIFSSGFNLKDYYDFSYYSEEWDGEDWDTLIEIKGQEERNRLLALAKENGWHPDGDLASAINGDGVGIAIKVQLKNDKIELEVGTVGGESERSAPSFWYCGSFGMPEINKLIADLINACILKG